MKQKKSKLLQFVWGNITIQIGLAQLSLSEYSTNWRALFVLSYDRHYSNLRSLKFSKYFGSRTENSHENALCLPR